MHGNQGLVVQGLKVEWRCDGHGDMAGVGTVGQKTPRQEAMGAAADSWQAHTLMLTPFVACIDQTLDS